MFDSRKHALKRRLATLAGLCLVASGLGAVVAAPAAMACTYGNSCWYSSTNLNGSECPWGAYTNGYIAMTCLVDDSESSYDNQYADGCDYDAGGDPWFFLRDTYYDQHWSIDAGTYNGMTLWTFNNVYVAETGTSLPMNNKFNMLWNLCVAPG
jgi:hypothetical protein